MRPEPPVDNMPLSADDFASMTHVSRETMSDYIAWEQLLKRWNSRINLVAPRSLTHFWRRHALDSWQISRFLPHDGETIVDFGSGAGFPGVSAAIHCKNQGQSRVLMIESAGKKASFLRQVIRELKLPADVSSERIENLVPLSADVITARAFAPLDRLLEYAFPHTHTNTKFVLLKGETVEQELEIARNRWTFKSETIKSITSDEASVLLLSHVELKR